MASIPSRIGAALNLSGPFRYPCPGKTGMQRIQIREASWPADRMALETVRCEVFVKEQNVSRSLEFDGLDAGALHWLAFTPEEEPVGTLRRCCALTGDTASAPACCVMRSPRRRRTVGAKSG
jgi:hypothetical protein